MKHPIFKYKSDLPSKDFWALMLGLYTVGGLVCAYIGYITRGWN